MVKIVVENFSEDALKKLYCDLDQYDRQFILDEECEVCGMPTLLHSGNETCTRMSELEIFKGWSLFKKKMKPIKNRYRDNIEKMQRDSNFTQELKEHEQKDHE